MHMADALVSPSVGANMFVLTGVTAAYSINKLKKDEDFKKKIPTMGVMGAFVFATQMVNFTIPGTGSSGHLCGGLLLSSILGPYAGFLSMIGVLLIQCLFFADGGLLALGANCWNMAFYCCFIGSLLWKFIMKNGMSKKKIVFSSILGSVLTLEFGAFSVVIETLISGITELPFGIFALAMGPIHLAIGLVEGLITSAVLCFIYVVRPEMLYLANENTERLSYRKILAILAVLFVIIGGEISLLASSNPDGLEWSLEKVTGSSKLETDGTTAYSIAERVQEATSILPDYAFKNSETAIGTIFSGILGGILVIAILSLLGFIVKFERKKVKTVNE